MNKIEEAVWLLSHTCIEEDYDENNEDQITQHYLDSDGKKDGEEKIFWDDKIIHHHIVWDHGKVLCDRRYNHFTLENHLLHVHCFYDNKQYINNQYYKCLQGDEKELEKNRFGYHCECCDTHNKMRIDGIKLLEDRGKRN